MGFFGKRKSSRAIRKAETKAIATKAKLEAKFDAKKALKDAKAARKDQFKLQKQARKTESKQFKQAFKAHALSEKNNLKIAQTQAKVIENNRILTASNVRRYLSVARLLTPILLPLAYRGITALRSQTSTVRANRLGVPVNQIGSYSGRGSSLSARIVAAKKSVSELSTSSSANADVKKFASTVDLRLEDLGAAVNAAERMPASRRQAAHAAIARELDSIESDILHRLGLPK